MRRKSLFKTANQKKAKLIGIDLVNMANETKWQLDLEKSDKQQIYNKFNIPQPRTFKSSGLKAALAILSLL